MKRYITAYHATNSRCPRLEKDPVSLGVDVNTH